MSLRVHVREGPERAIALVASSHVLTFRLAPTGRPPPSGATKPPQFMLDFQTAEDADMRDFIPMRAPPAHGTLGVFAVQGDVFVCVITGANPAATVRPGEHVQRIMAVDFLCLNRGDFDHLVGSSLSMGGYDDPYEERHALGYVEDAVVHPCHAMQHVLGGGTFYYSVDFDLTTRLQARIHERSAFDPDALERGFLWNAYLLEPLLQFRSHLSPPERKALDEAHFLTLAIRGFVGAITIPSAMCPLKADPHQPSMLTLISRLSCRRAGTRFNARGIDDAGNVANFVETETLFYSPDGRCYSFTQVRGSVPVFWEQTGGLLPQQQKIQLTRSREATQPAFDRHFEDLELKYGAVQILNLLGQSKSGEVELTNRYNQHVRACSINARVSFSKESTDAEHAMLRAVQFDYNAESRGGQGSEADRMLRQLVRDPIDGFAYFMAIGLDPAHTAVLLQQEGVFRVNCLDCLDRTNLAQTLLSRVSLETYFAQQNYQHEHFAEQKHQSLPQYAPPSSVGAVPAGFWPRHSTLWADNGDALSRIYAGTGALKSSVTRHGKVSLAGALADARKTATRMYMNAFVDTQRQAVIDALLGHASLNASGEAVAMDEKTGSVQLYDPLHAAVNAALAAKKDIYTTLEDITVWAGSFNLNGRRTGLKTELDAWLWPRIKMASGKISGGSKGGDMSQGWTDEGWADGETKPDVVAVGFQEIVELTANNIMATEPTRRQEWEEAVARTLNMGEKKGEYVLLRSGQLVGAALLVFVKTSTLSIVRNAEGAIKKTGMSGMAGNKGAVAIRLDFAQTRLCFVTAHLAAGFANYDERNRDYATIAHGLRFPRGRGLSDHDAVVWLGDFNYRIGLSNEKVRPVAFDASQWPSLFRHDQLNLQMVAGQAFPYFREAPIRFAPTYRYDVGTDTYDSSEKQRIPAWTDRLLWRGEIVKALAYGAAPVRCSDHRPVFGLFRVQVSVEDEKKKAVLRKEIDREVVARGVGGAEERKSDEEVDLLGDSPREAEGGRWWLSNGLPARSTVADDHPNAVPNLRRPANPFTPSAEPDWVMVPKPGITASKPQPPSTSKPSDTKGKSTTPPEVPPPRRSKATTTTSGTTTPSSSPAPSRPSLSPAPSEATNTPQTEPPPSSLDGSVASSPSPLRKTATSTSKLSQATSASTRKHPAGVARKMSSASTASSAAPPVPRKPVALSSRATESAAPSMGSGPKSTAPRPGAVSQASSQSQSTHAVLQKKKPPMQFPSRPVSSASTSYLTNTSAAPNTLTKAPPGGAGASKVINTGFPPPPRRMTGSQSTLSTGPTLRRTATASSQGSSSTAQGDGERETAPPPPLPSRRGTDSNEQEKEKEKSRQPLNVMDDVKRDEGDGLNRFVALQPRR